MLTHDLKILLSYDREKAFALLYEEVFPAVARFVCRMGGTFQDAKDIFQDAVIIFYEKTLAGHTNLQVSAQAYIMGIAKHLWNRRFRTGQRAVPLDTIAQDIAIPYDVNQPSPKEQHLGQYLALAGEKCMNMLQSFYYLNMSMQDIAEAFGFGSIRSATVQKFKCLEKVRQKVKTWRYEEIFE